MLKSQPLIINGWKIYAHSLFLNQLKKLTLKVEKLKQKYPQSYQEKKATKLLAAINKLAFEIIPQEPNRKEYRQGNTLGKEYRHWFRAKFFQQYRLFFRFHQESKIIVYVWVNDEQSKRVYGSETDAYEVFRKMLHNGNPPDSWEQLLIEVQSE
ncbi:type II toxin-antitoxin system YhaV family toxin [Geminocystis sp. CENA526]|uniref:type II toxin-antitoxin system YhaV family toxin n=1 Tax=Geminocystis sp. CENA526 TaxID=1355871 RepID=UPI003D6FA922